MFHPTVFRILILYNARSGHRRINFKNYLKALEKKGAEVEARTIGKEFNLKELLSDVEKFSRVVVAGGDGTVSTVAGLMQNSGVPLVAYPGGTANLLALNLNMPSNPEAMAEVTLRGKAIATDLGEMEYLYYTRRDYFRKHFLKRDFQGKPVKIYFSIMAGCGFAAHLMSHAQTMKSVIGEAAYWLSAFWNLFPHRARFKLLMDGKEVDSSGIGILIVNFEKIQFDLKVVSGSLAQDGKFEIIVVKARSLFGLIPILWGALCERLGFHRASAPDIFEIYHASDIEVTCDPPMKFQFDGEILKKMASFKVRVRPKAALLVYGEKAEPAAV